MRALHQVAADGLQQRAHGGVFDAFCDHAQAEPVGEVDGRAHDARIARVFGHAEHEGLVDLQFIDRQPLEVAQGRVAGAEVVDRQAEAEAAQLLQGGHGQLGLVHHGAFGELQAEGLGRQAVALQHG